MIRKIIIIIFIVSIVFLVSCTNLDNYVPIEKYDEVHLAYVEAKQDRTVLENENKSLQEDVDSLENEVEKYQYLLNNLNYLLSNVYYVYEEKDDGSSVWGTGFSIEHKGKFYLLTAGHIVDGEYGIFKNLGFKANFSNNWIYPKLLTYNNDYLNRNDYAVFYTDNITNGFKVDNEKDLGLYVLGSNSININTIGNSNNIRIIGESGSPIIDYEGEIIGIIITDIFDYYVRIDTILEVIDNLE